MAAVTAQDTFEWWGVTLPLFTHPYNSTAQNERAVEVACVLCWLTRCHGEGLEVGNVLQHYGPVCHRIIDRYEKAAGVEPLDVFDVTGRYDWVLSVSTLEHVRWDEPEKDPDGAVRALQHLRSLLRPAGRMIVTVPLGHHLWLDRHLLTEDTGVTRACTLVQDETGWRQTERPLWRPYGRRTIWAESVWIGEWQA